MCVPISRTNTWRPNQTWKTPRSFWLHFSVFKVRDCHNKHRGQQVGERFLQPPCAQTQWGPPAASQTRRCLVPDRGGVSGRYVGPPAGLMNGGFLSGNHTWTEEKECQVGPRAARLLVRSEQVFPTPKHPLSLWLNKHRSRVHFWTHKEKHTCQNVQVVQKQNRPCQ